MKKIVLLISLFISLSTIAQNKLDTIVKSKINLCKSLYQEDQLFIVNGKISTKKEYNKIDINIIKSIDSITIVTATGCNGRTMNAIFIRTKTKKELRKEKRRANRKKRK